MKKILIITGSRSEFGLIKPLVKKLKESKHFNARLVVTGSHLVYNHGNTYKEIEKENIKIFKKIKINNININKNKNLTIGSIVKGLDEFYKFFLKANPDLVIIPCDIYEMLGPAFEPK